jgi:hypothetical protein
VFKFGAVDMNETEAKNARLAEGKSVDDIKENL